MKTSEERLFQQCAQFSDEVAKEQGQEIDKKKKRTYLLFEAQHDEKGYTIGVFNIDPEIPEPCLPEEQFNLSVWLVAVSLKDPYNKDSSASFAILPRSWLSMIRRSELVVWLYPAL